MAKLKHIAARAAAGLDAEPGQVPQSVIIEDVSDRTQLTQAPEASGVVQLRTHTHTSLSHRVHVCMHLQAPVPDLELPSTSDAAPPTPTLTPASAAGAAAATANGPSTATSAERATSQAASASAAPSDPGLQRWAGRVALVSGASSGIGWATCEALAKAGAS